MLKQIKVQLKDANNVNRKKGLSMQTNHPWIIFESWYFDVASISFVELYLLDFDV
jgi:hypothetical protein